jgi:hypothetical protein
VCWCDHQIKSKKPYEHPIRTVTYLAYSFADFEHFKAAEALDMVTSIQGIPAATAAAALTNRCEVGQGACAGQVWQVVQQQLAICDTKLPQQATL